MDFKEQLRAVYELLGDPQLTKIVAKMFSNLIKDLEAEGFSRDEALKIAANYGQNINK